MLPRVIMLDQDPKFTNAFSMHFSKEVVLKLRLSTTLHSQMDGKKEHVNGVLKQYLKNLVRRTKEIGRIIWVERSLVVM